MFEYSTVSVPGYGLVDKLRVWVYEMCLRGTYKFKVLYADDWSLKYIAIMCCSVCDIVRT